MKRNKISLLAVVVFVFLLSGTNVFAFSADSVLSHDIKEADGTSGQDTNSGSGVKTGHIQNRAITSSKIGFYGNVVVVAPSGGDFTNPVDAMNSITDASPTNPYLVKIMPGVYNIGSSTIEAKSGVDIEGSGIGITKIFKSAGGPILSYNGVHDCEVRNIFLESNNAATGDLNAIFISSSYNITISNNALKVMGGNSETGIYITNSSNASIYNTSMDIDGLNIGRPTVTIGIAIDALCSAVLDGVTIDVGNNHEFIWGMSVGGSVVVKNSKIYCLSWALNLSGYAEIYNSTLSGDNDVWIINGGTLKGVGVKASGQEQTPPQQPLPPGSTCLYCYDGRFIPF